MLIAIYVDRETRSDHFGLFSRRQVRDLRVSFLGQLTRITGTVTRTSEVRFYPPDAAIWHDDKIPSTLQFIPLVLVAQSRRSRCAQLPAESSLTLPPARLRRRPRGRRCVRSWCRASSSAASAGPSRTSSTSSSSAPPPDDPRRSRVRRAQPTIERLEPPRRAPRFVRCASQPAVQARMPVLR